VDPSRSTSRASSITTPCFTLAESPLQQGLLWAGTDDGLIHVTRDDGQTWHNVTPKDMPEWSMVSIIEPSPHEAGSAFAAIDRHKLDDFKPLIYRTQRRRQDLDPHRQRDSRWRLRAFGAGGSQEKGTAVCGH